MIFDPAGRPLRRVLGFVGGFQTEPKASARQLVDLVGVQEVPPAWNGVDEDRDDEGVNE